MCKDFFKMYRIKTSHERILIRGQMMELYSIVLKYHTSVLKFFFCIFHFAEYHIKSTKETFIYDGSFYQAIGSGELKIK